LEYEETGCRIKDENESLRYLVDALFQHFVQSESALESFMDFCGGSRARVMLRAFNVVYPDRRSRKKLNGWVDRVIERLKAVRFAQKIERKCRKEKPASVGRYPGA
jgi:hypothetical protein